MPELIRIGTAGWAIPRQCAEHFPRDGSGLERYAARFTAVEINSTFHRSHKPHTFARWAEAVPEGFRFAVKMPKRISHELRLLGTGDPLRRFWEEVRDLDPKLGPLLLQLPPSLVYDPLIVEPFFELLRASTNPPPHCLRAPPSDLVRCRGRWTPSNICYRSRRGRSGAGTGRRPARRRRSFRLLPPARRAADVLLRL